MGHFPCYDQGGVKTKALSLLSASVYSTNYSKANQANAILSPHSSHFTTLLAMTVLDMLHDLTPIFQLFFAGELSKAELSWSVIVTVIT